MEKFQYAVKKTTGNIAGAVLLTFQMGDADRIQSLQKTIMPVEHAELLAQHAPVQLTHHFGYYLQQYSKVLSEATDLSKDTNFSVSAALVEPRKYPAVYVEGHLTDENFSNLMGIIQAQPAFKDCGVYMYDGIDGPHPLRKYIAIVIELDQSISRRLCLEMWAFDAVPKQISIGGHSL